MWKEATPEQKKPFEVLALEDKERYKRDLANGVVAPTKKTATKEPKAKETKVKAEETLLKAVKPKENSKAEVKSAEFILSSDDD